MDKLKELVQPLINYLKENCHSHSTITFTENFVQISVKTNYDEDYDVMYLVFEDMHNTYADEDNNGIAMMRKASTDDIVGIIIHDWLARERNYDDKHDTLYVRFRESDDSFGKDIAKGYVLFQDIITNKNVGLLIFDYKNKGFN